MSKIKVRTPKEWNWLSEASKDKISQYCVTLLNDQENKDMRIVVELIIKMMCCVLYDTAHLSEVDLMMMIGNLQGEFKMQTDLVARGKQLEYLDRRMKEIFKENGFPQMFIDNLLGEKDPKSIEGFDMRELLG